jgi:alkylated DNA repair dioxygenase AlkB
MASPQSDLFGDVPDRERPGLPPGFRYERDVITHAEERELLDRIRDLPFAAFQFHGFTGNRRTVSFGWKYDFSRERVERVDDVPDFLHPLRQRAAAFADLRPEDLQQALVIEYQAGAGIGWHRDKMVFGEVVGVSLLAPCTFRLRRRSGRLWERVNIEAEPRSMYLLSGESRTVWEHSIPPVDSLRYSITFRNLRQMPGATPTHATAVP